MLGGGEPLIIFQFSILPKSIGTYISKIPVISKVQSFIEMPPIPIYLSEQLTGLFVDAEDKNVDVDTDTETTSDGSPAQVSQKAIGNVVTVNLFGKKDSIGLILLSALIDLIYPKVTSGEYAISYLNGATTIFRGKLGSYSVSQNSQDDRLSIKIEITKGESTPTPLPEVPVVPNDIGALPL